MKLLARYVLSEVLQLFVLSLVTLTLVLVLCGIGKEALDHGLGIGPIARLLPYVLPKAVLFAVPATILFAVTNVFNRMSSAGEIIALKSLGISPGAVLWPVWGLAVALSLVTYWLNDVSFGWADRGLRIVVLDAVEEIAYGLLRTQRTYHSDQFSVIVKRVEDRKLIYPTFTFKAKGDSPGLTLTCEDAELKSDAGSGVLTVICHNGTINLGGTSFEFSDTFERQIPLIDPNRDPDANLSPAQTRLRMMPERIAKQREKIARLEQELAAHSAYLLASGDFSRLLGSASATELAQLRGAHSLLNRMRTEPPRRWANGFSCLCFVLVGAPMAILRRFSDGWASFFVCFMPILIVYYPLMMYGVDRSKSGALPPLCVWLANGVLFLWGLWLLRRVYRY